MQPFKEDSAQAQAIKDYILEEFTPHYEEAPNTRESHPAWARLCEMGTQLWLDTGDSDAISKLWTRDFSAVTTNNTLLNQEIQKGAYDRLIPQAAAKLNELGQLNQETMSMELAFILNARHALNLVEQFDAFVSVEEHTALADQVEAAVVYARRYHRICPRRFYVKIPLTPAGILATRQLSLEGVPVNHTLGFSARQNYLAARIAAPAFVNVFLGRLNSFVADNQLGDGDYVGERATVASQRMVRHLRESQGLSTRQIGASLRTPDQVSNLAGIDVLTMPGKVARGFRDTVENTGEIVDGMACDYRPGLKQTVDPQAIRLPTLWEVPEDFVQTVERLSDENLDQFTPDDLVEFMAEHGFADLFPRWTKQHRQTSAEEGKIPRLDNWSDLLHSGEIGLDALINLAGLNSFATDQKSMDQRVKSLLA